MANAPSQDLKDILVTAGLGTFAHGTEDSTWGIYISKEPDEPNKIITLYDKGGSSPNPKWILDEPTVRIRVRGAKMGYQDAWTKIEAVKDALLGITPQTVNGTYYTGILMIGDITFIHYDDNNRPIFTSTWQVIREPATSTYRTGL